MYNNSVISDLLKVVNFRGWHNTDVPALSTDNTDTDSGDYYNHSDGIVSLDNLYACMPAGKDFNDFLTELKTDVINKSLKKVFRRKNLDRQTKELLKDNYLFNGSGRIVDTINKESRFVGFQIEVKPSMGLMVEINEIWTQFTEAQAVFPIRVFHSSEVNALQTINLNRTKINGTERHILPLGDVIQLRHSDNNHAGGGYFWIGYFEDDLTGLAINRNQTINSNCSSCGENFSGRRSPFLKLDSVYVDNSNLNGGDAFDEIYVNKMSSNNWGLNFRIAVKCDLSDWIKTNKMLFANIFQTVMKESVLDLYINSNTINSIQGFSVDRAAYTKEQMEKNKEIEKAIDEANFNMESDSPCFPRVRKKQIRWGVV